MTAATLPGRDFLVFKKENASSPIETFNLIRGPKYASHVMLLPHCVNQYVTCTSEKHALTANVVILHHKDKTNTVIITQMIIFIFLFSVLVG